MTERTDADRFATPPTPITAALGGKIYSIAIQRKGPTAAFRARLTNALGDVSRVQAIVEAARAAVDQGATVDFGELPLMDIAAWLYDFVAHGANDILDLMYEYDPALAEHREEIDAAAYDAECIAVLVEIIKVVFGPFLGGVLAGIGATPNETPPPKPTPSSSMTAASTNSPSASGA